MLNIKPKSLSKKKQKTDTINKGLDLNLFLSSRSCKSMYAVHNEGSLLSPHA